MKSNNGEINCHNPFEFLVASDQIFNNREKCFFLDN